MTSKKCNDCGQLLTLDNFHKNKGNKDGHLNKCKKCVSEYHKGKLSERRDRYRKDIEYRQKQLENSKRWKENNKEERKEYMKEYCFKNREKINECNRKKYHSNVESSRIKSTLRWHKYNSLKKSQDDGTLTEDIIMALKESVKNCIICGCAINNDNRDLDHIYPVSKGGVNSKFNVWPICQSCNRGKNNKNPYEYNRYNYIISGYPKDFLHLMRMACLFKSEDLYIKAFNLGLEKSNFYEKYGNEEILSFVGDKKDIEKFLKECNEVKNEKIYRKRA